MAGAIGVSAQIRRTVRVSVLMATTALTVVALAPEVAADNTSRTLIAQVQQRDFDIPAQPLTDALPQFGRQSGMQVSVGAGLIQGINSPGVRGSFTPEQALNRLLAGTGITYRLTSSDTAMLERGPSPSGGIMLDPVTVEGQRIAPSTSMIGSLPPEYAGGQVARGGRVGLLGNQDFMDTPFNQTSYTSGLIENQQGQMIADVLVGDPSVRDSGRKFGQASNAFFIRGLPFATFDASFNGLRGVFPNYRQPVEALERVEVLKGPNALLNGMGTSVAGDVNLVPKRAADEPLTRLTARYLSDGEVGTHVDVGRRFGRDNAWGVRVNGVYRNGDTPIDEQSGRLGMGAVALDYRGAQLRLSLDALHQKVTLRNVSPFSFVFATPDIPRPPSSDSAILLGGRAEHEESSVAVRAEYDFNDFVTGYVAAGYLRSRSDVVTIGIAGVRPNGNYLGTLTTDAYGVDTTNVQAGVHADFDTGPVRHRLALNADRYYQGALMRASGRNSAGPSVSANIYQPLTGRLPAARTSGNWVDNGYTERKSVGIADTLSFSQNRVSLTLGVRNQFVEQVGTTRAGPVTYDDSAWTPMVGIVVKPWGNDLSLYANYIEGLLQGFTVRDATSPDNGMTFPPYKTEQYEVGVKKDFGNLAMTVSLYQITQPSQLVDPATRRYSQGGEQRNRGIEWNLFGTLTPGLKVMGGISYVKAELTKTAGSATDGNQAAAVPKLQANLGVEWTPPAVPDLTFSARAIRTGAAYLDSANTQRVDGWTRYDIGVRYEAEIGGKPVTVRGNIDNLFDTDYWIAVNGGAALSAPRTYLLSVSTDF